MNGRNLVPQTLGNATESYYFPQEVRLTAGKRKHNFLAAWQLKPQAWGPAAFLFKMARTVFSW